MKPIFSLQKIFIVLAEFMSLFPNLEIDQSIDNLDFVYGTNHYNGISYSSALIPPSIDTIYLLSDHTSILAGKLTKIYYWPITNEYKADWDNYNDTIEGKLEIREGGDIFQIVDLTEYVIQYDGNNQSNTTVLYLKDEAIDARKKYENMKNKYRDDLYSYYKKLNEYNLLYQEALEKLQYGLITPDQLPIEPSPPDNFSLFSTDLLYGFPVNLPVGEYEVSLRLEDGSIQVDSNKKLVVFESLANGIGYEISNEKRWNLPDKSLYQNEVIYGLENDVYYIKPFQQNLYNERYYTCMNNPQNKTARDDRTIWVPIQSVDNVFLTVIKQQGIDKLNIQQYYVKQILGSKLGYEIIPFEPESMTSPTFTGFEVILNDSLIYKIKLMDGEGNVLPGSLREIRVLHSDRLWLIYIISALPLVFGIIVLIARRKEVRNIKVTGVG